MNSFRNFAPVPPKGWNSWDAYGASVREDEVKRNANYMAKHLKQFGYQYVVVDIQWYEPTADSAEYHDFAPLKMDQYSRLIPDEKRFPSAKNGQGFKELADYVHSLGLKFGIHMMRGIPRQAVYQNTAIKGTQKTAHEIALNNICPWNSDMYGVNMDIPEGQLYYNSVMDLYASWGVDFIKCDDIAYSRFIRDTFKKEVHALRHAIDQNGRKMVLSLSPGPAPIENASFFQQNANMWRITDDFWDQWPLFLNMFKRADEWSPISRPGNWPDCDMLPLGHIGIRSVGGGRKTNFTQSEQKTMMTLWCMMQSPLIIGGELSDLDDWSNKVLTNADLLAMDNELIEKYQIYRDSKFVVWQGRSSEHIYYAVFNISDDDQKISKEILDLLPEKAKDVWLNKNIVLDNKLEINKHDVCLLKK